MEKTISETQIDKNSQEKEALKTAQPEDSVDRNFSKIYAVGFITPEIGCGKDDLQIEESQIRVLGYDHPDDTVVRITMNHNWDEKDIASCLRAFADAVDGRKKTFGVHDLFQDDQRQQ